MCIKENLLSDKFWYNSCEKICPDWNILALQLYGHYWVVKRCLSDVQMKQCYATAHNWQLKRFQDLSSVKCRVEIILFFISNQPLWLPPSFKLWFSIFRLVRRAWPQMLEVLGGRSARNPGGRVTIDKGRGATRSLAIKIAVVSRESYSSPGL